MFKKYCALENLYFSNQSDVRFPTISIEGMSVMLFELLYYCSMEYGVTIKNIELMLQPMLMWKVYIYLSFIIE
jgi:hypothetical protein